ncbi:double-strand break repair helicase AddA [Elioraea rosea]|uniref:double-strand break repair helicase AddA n=1 Tax=Elioraea rosea TaxID=2492390 RepID=UPI001181EE2C|nr:double-strand break repair helicase AddA [Elioraea rosea]
MSTGDARREAIAAQRRAADPSVSAWVSASAGSGKTTLLTARVLRLLLGGCEPGRILCLTYTRAAAAEMATRLATRLGEWAALPDDALADALEGLGVAVDEETRTRARGLFARVLDQPGGLRIATIHAFCQSLLRRFPIEAHVAPHFALIEERDSQDLLAAARDEALGEVSPEIAVALETVAPLAASDSFSGLVTQVLGSRGRLSRALAASNAPDGVATMQRRVLSVGLDETEEELLARACGRDFAILARAAEVFAGCGKEDKDRAILMRAWLAREPEARTARWDDWCCVFLTDKGVIRSRLATRQAVAAMGDIASAMEAEAEFVLEVERQRRALRAATASSALIRLVSPVIAAYEKRKNARAGLDYDDLIGRARALLASTDTAWVQYKLDGGLDHVLLDEAQDTSAAQWEVVERLTEEFFAGEGARDGVARTLFAVGDVKQSIYRFQGAAPAEFARARERTAARVTAVHGEDHFRAEQVAVSFRSAAPVLALVDAVFDDADVARGVALDGGAIVHRPVRAGQAGRVELWPPIAPDPVPEATEWDPNPRARARDGEEKLADALAAQIDAWLRSGEVLPARGRPMRPGDILVLVRRRRAFVNQLVRALKRRDVPVSGIDRLALVEELAVMDILATLDSLLMPEDDLTFAAALRSPLFGLGDSSLMDLAVGRGRLPLRFTLRRRAHEREEWRRAEERFSALAARADIDTPHALIARLLGPQGGRARLLARLGPDAADPIDELLNATLAHERSHPPGLQGFLAWLRAGGNEIKREHEAGANEVRVMTVHGAKGLESPVVILADTTSVSDRPDPLVWVADRATHADVPLWAPRKEFRAEPIDAARAEEQEREREEYRRLLYVALTRAEDRLLVTGALNRRNAGKEPGCWFDLVEAGFRRLAPLGAEETGFDPGALLGDPGWRTGGWRYATAQEDAPDRTREVENARPVVTGPVPAWAREPPPEEASPPRPLAPSREEGDEPAAASPVRGGDRGARRFRRGLLIHALLQHLPDLPPAQRRAAARAHLAAPGLGLSDGEIEEIAAETLAIVEDPGFAPLFAPEALAEAPVVGRVGDRVVAGQVDRLTVTETEVLVADFKTNRPPPERVEDVSAAYLRQMAAYRDVLRGVFPGRPVRCALVWTYAARMMELPDALLDRHAPAPI